MPNPKNIIGKGNRFPKGVSGNPKGRPKLPDLKEALANVLGDEKEQKTALEAIIMALRKKALSGDVRAAQLLFDRAYGSAIQKHEINSAVLQINITEEPPNRSEHDYTIPEVE